MELERQIEELKAFQPNWKLSAMLFGVRTRMIAKHDPFIHKLPLELASYISILSLPIYASELKSIGSAQGHWGSQLCNTFS